MKRLFTITLIGYTSVFNAIAQPANNNCASATTLTAGAAMLCGQTTLGATLQGGECYTNYAGGSTEVSVWYRFTAGNDSIILNFIETNSPNCATHIRIYGPFVPGGGCIPACASAIYSVLQSGDPGHYILLTGLSIGSDYLVQIQGDECGGPGASDPNFCIGINNPGNNSNAGNASLISECGTAFSGNSYGGYWQNGTSLGFNNLDNNAGTTCGTCGEAGDDTPFIINNVSWFTFCSLTAGTWQITVNGISNCTLSPPNQGVQASVFTGTAGALVNQGNSGNPIPPGGSWTSPVLTVNSGQCAFLMIDGFAGDACDYDVTLTNLSGGCIVLPLEELFFQASEYGNTVVLNWKVSGQETGSYYTVEKSTDGDNYSSLELLTAIPGNDREYSLTDFNPANGVNYYRLKQADYEGNTRYSAVKAINFSLQENLQILVAPNPVDEDVIQIYLTGIPGGESVIRITDAAGKVISSHSISSITHAVYRLVIPHKLASGFYLAEWTTVNHRVVTQFIIH